MVAPYPVVDPRRARALAAELEAMARSLAPGWRADAGSGDAGRAVLEIAARLAEHVTRRLDETPRRDALAFLDLLEVPPPAARAALAPVVFTLAEKRTTPVVAPERTQLTATAEGEELVFETTTAITLTPASLTHLLTVDGRQDRIEEAPTDVIRAIPPSGLPTSFTALTFAAAGSRSLQLTPSIGLEPGQLVRIAGTAYRVKDATRTGMVELFEPLEATLAAGEPVTRITTLESFTLRDRQAHSIMIGHAELFDLEGPAIITLALEPPSLAAALMNLDLAIELYAMAPPTEDEASEADAPAWHELTRLGTERGQLRLAKTWTGKVEELELGGHKSRWLRLRLRGPITGEPEPVPRLRKLAIGVESLDLGEAPSEGAVGLTAASSNGNPLPLTTAFLPFGPEPRRFDTFAFAAPEMLTKRGGTARLEVRLLDGSVVAFVPGGGQLDAVPLSIGADGKLRALAIGADGAIDVTLIGKPGQADLPAPLEAASGLSLAAATTLAPSAATTLDLPDASPPAQPVAAIDRGGRIWTTQIGKAEDGSIARQGGWQLAADVDAENPVRDLVLLPASPPLLVARRDDGLWIRSTLQGGSFHPWRRSDLPPTPPLPEFAAAGQLVAVQDSDGDLLLELVLIDANGAVFSIKLDTEGTVESWQRVVTAAARTDIRPAAANRQNGQLLIYAADSKGRLLSILNGESQSTPDGFAELTLLSGTALDLAAPETDGAPPTLVAFAAGLSGAPVLVLLQPNDELQLVPLATLLPQPMRAPGSPPAVGAVLHTDGGPRVVLAGEQQSLAILGPAQLQVFQLGTFDNPIDNPDLSFEYWNGSSWARLAAGLNDGTANLAQSGDITFTVPLDIASTEIAGHQDYWIRVRLVGGDYGRAVYRVKSEDNDDDSTTQSITVDTADLAPPEIRLLVAGFTLDQRRPAERLLVEGNLSLIDQTQASASPSATVTLFASAAVPAEAASGTRGRALFLGFTRQFDVQPLSLWIEALEQGRETMLRAHVLEQGGWRAVTLEDETRGLDRSGFIHVFVPRPARPERLFGEERFWLCLAPAEPAADWRPVVAGLYPNAVRALHAETIEQEILGTSRGEPGQRHDLARPPVLTESLELRVREQLAAEEHRALVEAGGPTAVTRYPERGIAGDWVRWERRDSFIGAAPDARVFTVTAAGEARFGDNREGRIPPPGRDVIRAISYQRGGGEIGNVEAYAIKDVKSALESVEAVANPAAAAGGVDAAALDDLLEVAPTRLRHAGRALGPADLEALARDFSTDIRNARCLGAARPGGPIRLVVAWRNGVARCPVPTPVQREALARHLALAAWGSLVPADIEVVPPRWVEVAVEVTLRARSGELAAGLEIAAMERLTRFLDPLDGGPGGKGWGFGRPIFTSDLAALLLRLPGLDEIVGIRVSPETIPADGLICADPERRAIRLEVTVGAEERAP